jgi:cytochrome b involved in lipid metabolism
MFPTRVHHSATRLPVPLPKSSRILRLLARIVDTSVYDVTKFVDEHPGGSKILKRVAGKDATKQFWKYHNESVLKKYGSSLKVGEVGEKAKL